jgi:hypothetical protein
MKPRYLLPCACGREIPIETSQAGEVVRCECGAELEAPTLLRMSSLKRAPEPVIDATPRQSRWGSRQRLRLIGAIIAVPCLILAGLVFMTRPRLENVITHRPLDTLSFYQTWQIWQDLRIGVDRQAIAMESVYKDVLKFNKLWLGAFLAVAGVGCLLILSSWFVPNPQRPAPTKR